MNESIQAMLQNPGLYCIEVPHSVGYFFCEVDSKGRPHQLNRYMARDGGLRADGWGPNVIATKIEPREFGGD